MKKAVFGSTTATGIAPIIGTLFGNFIPIIEEK